jgi:hypothetical protein
MSPARLTVATIAMVLVITIPGLGDSAPRAGAAADSLPLVLTPGDPAAANQLIQPEKLARLLADSTGQRPEVLHVGFKFLFQGGHIPRSRYIGPGSKPEGLAVLKQALRGIPRKHTVVLYCGCCPWIDCPNVRPAFGVARAMGFRDVRVLYVARDLKHDWIDKGLPVSKGDR